MEKIDSKKHLKLLVLLCMLYGATFSQAKSGVENYNFLSKGKKYLWMPIVHYQTPKGIYAELRYNYEEAQTGSLYGGKIFTSRGNSHFSITPMIGFSIGAFKSIAVAANTEIDYQKIFISSQSQFNLSLSGKQQSFFFTWSEIGLNFSKLLFGGLAVQYTLQQKASDFEPGIVLGLTIKNVSIPVYLFSPFRNDSYVVLGLNYEFNLKTEK